jgi:hypothetical protein
MIKSGNRAVLRLVSTVICYFNQMSSYACECVVYGSCN